MKRIAAAVAALVLLVSGSACSNSEPSIGRADRQVLQQKGQNGSASGGSSELSGVDEGAPERAGGVVSQLGQGGDQQAAPLPPLPGLPSKVIKTASVEIKVSKGRFQIQFSKANVLAESLGGFVSSSNVSETSGKIASGTLTIRVPADKFQTAFARLKALGKVTAEEQSGQDVSREFVDLEARLRHAKAQEAFFLKLLDQSKTIADLVQVQQQLGNIQLQIEQLQGQLQFLKDQTDFSTITARIYEPGSNKPGPVKGLGRAWRQAVDAAQAVLAGVIVAAGYVVPLALLAAIVVFGYRGILRARSKSNKTE